MNCLADEPPREESGWLAETWDNFKSPVTTESRYILLGGSGLTATLLLFEDQIVDPTQKDTVEDTPLHSTSKLGDLAGQGIPNALYAAGMLTFGLIEKDSKSLRNASGMFQATLYSISVTTVLKHLTKEPRPNDSNTKTSFPSGHATSAFAFASYVGCRHTLPWGIGAYALAAFVGYSRMNDNAHYIHDVVAGATIGASYGIGVCLRENERAKEAEITKPNEVTTSWYLAPLPGGAAGGVSIIY